jgi:DNA polymerase/3'-5' exonuclease PolX
MSKAETKTPYAEALAKARALEQALRPACERVLIAGSLRRKRSTIGDLELVVLPETASIIDLFGETAGARSLLDDVLAPLGLSYTLNGPKFKQFSWQGMTCDLFICSSATWAVNATLRTGCAEFSHWLVTEKRRGGARPAHMEFKDGVVYEVGKPLDIREERELFMLLELPWIEPEERTPERVATLWRR